MLLAVTVVLVAISNPSLDHAEDCLVGVGEIVICDCDFFPRTDVGHCEARECGDAYC